MKTSINVRLRAAVRNLARLEREQAAARSSFAKFGMYHAWPMHSARKMRTARERVMRAKHELFTTTGRISLL